MNAIQFGHTNDRDYNRGVCMWSWDREWCAKPLTVENYRGNFNQPDGYRYGSLYGIHVPDGMPEYESLWICNDHRQDFLTLNSSDIIDTTIWQFDHHGQGTDVTHVPMREVSVRIDTHLSAEDLSSYLKGELTEMLRRNEDIQGWKYLKVVS